MRRIWVRKERGEGVGKGMEIWEKQPERFRATIPPKFGFPLPLGGCMVSACLKQDKTVAATDVETPALVAASSAGSSAVKGHASSAMLHSKHAPLQLICLPCQPANHHDCKASRCPSCTPTKERTHDPAPSSIPCRNSGPLLCTVCA